MRQSPLTPHSSLTSSFQQDLFAERTGLRSKSRASKSPNLSPRKCIGYMRICFTDVFSVTFLFFVFAVRHKNTRQPFSGTAERIFMKLLPNDSGENVVSNVVPKWGLGPPINFWG